MNSPTKEEVKKLKDTFLNPDLLDPEFNIHDYVDKDYECGQDLIDLFKAYHSRPAVGQLDKELIGKIATLARQTYGWQGDPSYYTVDEIIEKLSAPTKGES